MVCDLDSTGFDGLTRGPLTRTMVTTSRGVISNEAAYPVVGEDAWRAIFDVDFSDLPLDQDDPIDLRVYVAHDGAAKTETLVLQLFPSQLRELLSART